MPVKRAICFILWLVLQVAAVNSQSCNFSNTGLNFGNINLVNGTAFSSTGTFTATCTGLAGQSVRICANFNDGSGGSNATGSERYMLRGLTALKYNIYSNAGRNKIWGSNTWGKPPVPPNISLTLNAAGSGSTSQPVYGQIFAAQTSMPTGTFLSDFGGINTVIGYSYTGGPPCQSIVASNLVTVPFTVVATNNSTCTVSTTNLDFGSYANLSANRDTTNNVAITCTTGTLYQVGLNGGLANATNPALRRMTNSSTSQYVTYGIYRDAGRTLPWGNISGSTMSATGTGLVQNFVGYGRVPAQATPAGLVYTDTVVVTVTY